MGFRTVVIKERCKLDLKLNYMVCRKDVETKIFIPEISFLILETTNVSITTALISELVKNNVKIIFCDEKHNPESEICALYGNYNCPKRLKEQLNWTEESKANVWQKIIELKIEKQSRLLCEVGENKSAEMLKFYMEDVTPGDKTNREGHAAKVYFNSLFGQDYSRRNESNLNMILNYGYAVLLACFNREIVKSGYLTQLGIWHSNEFNEFNLSCDIFEPFRVIVDKIALQNGQNDENRIYKDDILEIFNMQFKIDGKLQFFENAVSIYCQSVFRALKNNNPDLITCYE